MALFELIKICAGVMLLAAAAAAGMILSRRISFSGLLSGYGTSMALLLTLVLLLLWKDEAVSSYWMTVLIFIAVPALVGAAAAILCAFWPAKSSFALALMAGLVGAGSVLLRAAFGLRFSWNTPVSCVVYGLVLFLSGMGMTAAGRKFCQTDEAEEREETLAEPETELQGTGPAGSLILLAEPYMGQQIPLTDGEELRLGCDAAYCHLILELPGRQPCLCGVRWLGQRNTYLVTSYVFSGLRSEDGQALPGNSSIEAQPGKVFLDGQSGQAIFQVG